MKTPCPSPSPSFKGHKVPPTAKRGTEQWPLPKAIAFKSLDIWPRMALLMVLVALVAPAQAAMVTVTGRLTEDADDPDFYMRDTVGTPYKVDTRRSAVATTSYRLRAGDIVRVYGNLMNGIIYAGNVRYLGRQYASQGQRLVSNGYRVRSGTKATLSGTLINDADNNAFKILDRRGRAHKIFAPQIPYAYGVNKLEKGQLVRAYGYWMADEEGWPYLEATNVRLLRNARFR